LPLFTEIARETVWKIAAQRAVVLLWGLQIFVCEI
jgi:hypothetical protein